MDDTIEEGRLALLTLERQLGGNGGGISGNQESSVHGTNRTTSTLSSERRLLDQAPRDLRLNNRMGSPLGLTIEELDDRGLLEGGMVPNYYASSRQRGRRPLEMKKRSSRLLERGKETITKMTNALFHMVRVLNKRGLHMEEYCLPRDTKCTGFVPKSHFVSILRNIGLPFGSKDLNDIILRYTSAPKYDAVDYHAFLRDAGVKLKHDVNKQTDLEDTRDGAGSIQSDLSAYTTFLFDMKRMLLEAVQRLGKQTEDVYRMFARWDNEGSGNITATQFLRVLMRLHVDLSDQDQDFLVELLDTTSMGRIDFESLLSFCLSDLTNHNNNDTNVKSPHSIRAYTDDNINDLTASTIVPSNNGYHHTMDGHGESSVGSNNKNAQGRRPHTASPSRHDLQFIGGGRGSPDRHRPDQSAFGSNNHNHHGNNTATVIQRPTTASGRVASSAEYRQSRQDKGVDRENVDGLNVAVGPNYHRTRPQSAAGLRGVSDYVADLPDDVINDEDDYMGGFLGGTSGSGIGVGGGTHTGNVLNKSNSQVPGRGDRSNTQGPGPSARDDLYENVHTPSQRTNKETIDRPRPASSSAASHHRHHHVLRDVDLNVYVAEAKDMSRHAEHPPSQQLRHEREYKQRAGDSVSMVPESGSSQGGGEPERNQEHDRDRENDDDREDDNRDTVMERVVDRDVKGDRGSRGVSHHMGHPTAMTHLGHVSQGRSIQQQSSQSQPPPPNQGYEEYDNNDESMELFPDGASFNDNTLLTEPDDYTQGIPAIQRDPWQINSLDSSMENGYPSSIHGGTGGGRFSPQPPIVLSTGGHHHQNRPSIRSGHGQRQQGSGIRPGTGVSVDNPIHQRGGRSQHRDDQRHPHSRGTSRDAREQGLGTLPHGVVYSNDAPKIYYPEGRTDGRTDGRTFYNEQNDGRGGLPYDPSSDHNNQHHSQQYQHGDGMYMGVGVRMGGPIHGSLNNHNNNNNNNSNTDLIITDYVNNMTSTGGGMNSDNLGDSEAMSVPADESPVLPSRYRENTQGLSGNTGTSSGGLFGPSQGGVHVDNESSFSEPIEHLNLLASQTLAAVRDLVLKRHRTGNKTIAEIYRHFDRKGKRFFNALDFMQATADLRIETTERVAMLAVAQIALDSPRDRVSLGEFNVFVSDITHHELEERVRRQAVEMFQKQGRTFHHTLHTIFTDLIHDDDQEYKQSSSSGQGQTAASQGRPNIQPRQGQPPFGFVAPQTFVSTLKKLGFKLSNTDWDRLVVRFDVYGQGTGCSSSRFIRMIESSDLWQQAEVTLSHQEVAAEEASSLRAQLKKQAYNGTTDTNNSSSTNLNEEMISMAEYLGIKVISERHLLWIVRDALNAPLPTQWAVLNDSKGKAFYYNRSTNQSRWDHPLDPHFRKLRDQHRAQYSYASQLPVGVGLSGSTPMYLPGDQGMTGQGGVMDDDTGLLSSQPNIYNNHHLLPVVVNGITSGQPTSLSYNTNPTPNPHTVNSPITTTSGINHNYSQSQHPSQTSVPYHHHHYNNNNNNLSHNYPHGGNNNDGGNHRMMAEGRNDSKQGLAPPYSNPTSNNILPTATQSAPKIFHQHFESKVQEVVGGNVHGVRGTSSSTRPVSAPVDHHHQHHSKTPQLPPPRAEGKSTPNMTTAMFSSAQTQAKIRSAGYSEYAEKMIAAEHAYRPYNWSNQDNSNQAKKTTATTTSSSAYNHPTSSGTKQTMQKPRASSATVGRRTTSGVPGPPGSSSSGSQHHQNHNHNHHPIAVGSNNQDMEYHRSSSAHHDRPGAHHFSQGKRTGPGASTLPVDKTAQGKGGYYDLPSHQPFMNVNTGGLPENDHNPLRYAQGGQQGINQGGYMQSNNGQGGNHGYYNNHSHNQFNGTGQGQVGYNDNNEIRLDRSDINETKLASMFSSDVITRLDQAFGAKR